MANLPLSMRGLRPEEGFYTSSVETSCGPIRTFLPTGYEPNYPYPLLVFFHPHGSDEDRVLQLAPRISRRNFLAISLRGPIVTPSRLSSPGGYSWGLNGEIDPSTEDYVFEAILQTRRRYHVHSERIYLVGVCEGACPAYRIALGSPDCFGGVVSLNGAMPRIDPPRLNRSGVRDLNVFIAHGIANVRVPLAWANADHHLFYTAGMPVQMHTYTANRRLHKDMLRDMNRWIIEQCK